MFDDSLQQAAVGLATSQTLIGVVVAATIMAVLQAAGYLRMPRRVRPVFLALYGVLVIGLGSGYALGLFKSPTRAAAEMAATAESTAASAARLRNVTPTDDPATVGALPSGVVYIQVPDMDARFGADPMWKALKAAGFRSPGIELVTGGAPSRAEVRYFNDADLPIAERVAAIAARLGLEGAVVRSAATYKAPPGQIELWYPR